MASVLCGNVRPCLDFFFYHSSLLSQFPSLITHHLKYPITLHKVCLASSLNLSSLKIFNYLWVPPVTWCSFYFFFFFFFLQPPVPKLIEPSEKKKKTAHRERRR